MTHTDEDIIASLEKPGAGIAWYYRLLNRTLITPLVARRTPWSECRRRFIGIDAELRAALDGLTDAQLTRRVLVPHLMGLEDSSRYWSVAMTARHLAVVGPLMVSVMLRLSRRVDVSERVDFVAVKPEAARNEPSSVSEYLAFSSRVVRELDEGVGNVHAPGTTPHPWFGELTVPGWYWLLGTHSWVHLRQVRAIRRAL